MSRGRVLEAVGLAVLAALSIFAVVRLLGGHRDPLTFAAAAAGCVWVATRGVLQKRRR